MRDSERVRNALDPLPSELLVEPLAAAPDLTMRPPGSKSITNRALLCAAVAAGRSRLTGLLLADDTAAMLDVVQGLGATVNLDETTGAADVVGTDPRQATASIELMTRQSGTTSRFVLPLAALRPGHTVVDGSEQLRARPFGPLFAALRDLGSDVRPLGEHPDRLPVQVTGPVTGGEVRLPGHLSSQFLSGLLMSGPLMPRGLHVQLTSPLVSVPYVTMTAAVMAAFGVTVDDPGEGRLAVQPQAYRPTDYDVEPDASAASYLMAAAAITGGRVTVEGLGTGSLQGDMAFADILEQMGATVDRTPRATTVRGPAQLHGVDVDMADLSDTAQTLAAVACFGSSPTRVRGIGFIRGKETDRIGAVVTELRRAGIDAVEHDDGFTVHPGTPEPTSFETYDDHRMAMSLALLGLRVPGIRIRQPGCVAKTYPAYFADLARLGGATAR